MSFVSALAGARRSVRSLSWVSSTLVVLALASTAPATQEPPRPDRTALTEDEARRVEQEIGGRCGVRAPDHASRLPWYYYYAVGVRFHEKGDDRRALEAMRQAIERNPSPALGYRVYGLWFLDYLPYTYLARIHDALNQAECARDARELSRKLEPRPRRNDRF